MRALGAVFTALLLATGGAYMIYHTELYDYVWFPQEPICFAVLFVGILIVAYLHSICFVLIEIRNELRKQKRAEILPSENKESGETTGEFSADP